MRKTNNFGASVKEGENLSILKKAKTWFRKNQSKEIVQYFYSFEVSGRDQRWIRSSDYKACEICGKKLFRKEGSKVYQMKHMIFVDANGKENHTCGGLNWCFKRTKADLSEHKEENISLLVPDFEEFHDFEKNFDHESQEDILFKQSLIQEARLTFDRKVKPFIKKWSYCDIDKTNAYEFFLDLKKIEEDYLIFYDRHASSSFMSKLMNLTGVMYER
jgi:hypothetical protein